MSTDRRGVRQLLRACAGISLLWLLGTAGAYATGPTGAIGFAAAGYSASVADGVAIVVLDRLGGSSGNVSVTFGTADGSAMAGASYTGTSGTLSWSDGDATPRTIMVPIAAAGGGGAFSVVLLSVTGAGFGAIIQTAVSVLPAAPPPPGSGALEFSQGVYAINRGDGTLRVTVDRVQGASGAAVATYTTADGSAVSGLDYAAVSGTLNWPDGDSSPKSFIVPVSSQAAAGHTFSLSLLSAQGANFGDIVDATVNIAVAATITASWSPPTTNTDGGPLTDLAGYYICIGGTGNQPTQTIQVANPAVTSISIGNIGAGTYYLAAMAYDSSGAVSSLTGPVATTVQ
jgi:hypothetical protein